MKRATTNSRRTAPNHRKTAGASRSRWRMYATAGAASVIGCAASAEANIIYSGPIDHTFNAPPGGNSTAQFQLDKPGDYLRGWHTRFADGVHGAAIFSAIITPNLEAGAVAGFVGNGFDMFQYVSKLYFGQNLSTLPFVVRGGFLAIPVGGEDTGLNGQWQQPGTGFVGFRFNGGAGVQYGWARIHTDGQPGNTFTLIDYAFGTPGQHITAGETRTNSVPESGGSLGLLALGCAGLLAWRAARRAEANV